MKDRKINIQHSINRIFLGCVVAGMFYVHLKSGLPDVDKLKNR